MTIKKVKMNPVQWQHYCINKFTGKGRKGDLWKDIIKEVVQDSKEVISISSDKLDSKNAVFLAITCWVPKGQYRYFQLSRAPFHASLAVHQTPSCIMHQF